MANGETLKQRMQKQFELQISTALINLFALIKCAFRGENRSKCVINIENKKNILSTYHINVIWRKTEISEISPE
jgi:hypothetical protein